MAYKENIEVTKNHFAYKYSGVDVASLAKSAQDLLTNQGYKVIEGGGANVVYEKGNKVMRVLFGAFAKYFKFAVQIAEPGDGDLELKVTKHASGVAGGIIGMKQVKKELERLGELFKDI